MQRFARGFRIDKPIPLTSGGVVIFAGGVVYAVFCKVLIDNFARQEILEKERNVGSSLLVLVSEEKLSRPAVVVDQIRCRDARRGRGRLSGRRR